MTHRGVLVIPYLICISGSVHCLQNILQESHIEGFVEVEEPVRHPNSRKKDGGDLPVEKLSWSNSGKESKPGKNPSLYILTNHQLYID